MSLPHKHIALYSTHKQNCTRVAANLFTHFGKEADNLLLRAVLLVLLEKYRSEAKKVLHFHFFQPIKKCTILNGDRMMNQKHHHIPGCRSSW